jgi:HSP20 family protein
MRHVFFPNFTQPFFSDIEERASTSRIEETENSYLIQLDMPGVKREDLKISIESQHLVVEGLRKNRGTIRKLYSLPDDVDQDRIEAQLSDGVLELALHKKEQAKPKSIPIKEAKASFFLEKKADCCD